MNFVSEKEIEKLKEEGKEEEEYDPRPLFERLKAAKELKQEEIDAEKAEAAKIGLAEDEVDFLQTVAKLKYEKESSKKKEERELIEQQRRAYEQVDKPTSSVGNITAPKVKAGALLANKKEKPALGIIRKRKRSNDEEEQTEEKKITPKPVVGVLQQCGGYPTNLIKAGTLPGVGMYGSSSDSSDDEIDASSTLSAVTTATPSTPKTCKNASNTSLNTTA
ncbi:unnamed protein product [Bursaphelenchus xylophilus]|uniref:(pine wood nematode) hypothetical protein n=1 Tax=Bursaphelenchus xylophilus TaxID=6326 RepID=A0A1I7SEB1_BURXY|nr:unnamed protein product [Bursaphelenchus xylophilus]CAG9087413.1 unnamed protein product [Bursaphelenchus xylophilus]